MMRHLRLLPALAACAATVFAQSTSGPVATGVEGFPSTYFSNTDQPYGLTIFYANNVAPSNPGMSINNEALTRTGVVTGRATFSVSPGTNAYTALRSGSFTLRHFQGVIGTVGSVTLPGTPTFTFTGPPAPSISNVTVTALSGGNSRYTITGSNLVGGSRTNVSRTSPCSDPENRTIEPGSTATQLTIVLPTCSVSHQIVVFHTINYSVGDFNASAFIDLVSRPFTVSPVTLTLTSIDPNRGPMNTQVTFQAFGTGFVPPVSASFPGSKLIWQRNGTEVPLTTTFISPTQLTGVIPANLMINPQLGPAQILVENQSPAFCNSESIGAFATGCARSNTRPFTIIALTLTRLDLNRAQTRPATGAPFDFNVIGDGFAANAEVWWRPTAGATAVQLEVLPNPSPTVTQLRARIPASLLTDPRVARVYVRNPALPGGQDAFSQELDFTVFAGLELRDLNPRTAPAGTQTLTVTATGRGFTASTAIEFRDAGGARRPTITSRNLTGTDQTLVFTLDAPLLATRKTWDVFAVDGTNASSPAVPFEVTDGVVISDFTPKQRAAGSGAFDLVLDGSGFAAGAAVLYGTQTITPPAANITPTRITVNVTAPAQPGKVDVKVRVGTGTAERESNTVQIDFTAGAPTITDLSPRNVRANSGNLTLTIIGQNFLPAPTVTVGGANAAITGTPTATSITVQVPNDRLQTIGSVPVIVRVNNVNSAAFNLAVTAAGPSNVTLSVNQRAAGSGPFNLTISGTGLTGASVTFGGQAVTVVPGTTPTDTSIQVVIPNSLLQTTGVRPVVVTANGTSASVSFTVTAPVIPTTSVSSGDATVQPNGNTAASLSLAAAAPVDVTGTLELSFTPATGVAGLPANYVDPALAFVNGGQRRLDFRIPAAQTAALTTAGAPLGAINVGTVAGTVTVRVISMNAAGVAQNVTNIAPRTITVPAGPPTITPNSARLVDTPGNVNVRLSGFAPTRAITSATITFTIAAGVTVNGSTTFTVPLDQAFNPWFAPNGGGISHGSRFQLQIPFPVEGSTADITGYTISLTGPGNATSATVTGTR